MYGIQDKINQILRGAETIKKNSMTTDTPRTDAELEKPRDGVYSSFFSMASHAKQLERELNELWSRFDKQMEAEAEVERLRKEIIFREDMDAVAQEVWDELKAENAKLRQIVERYRVWATSESPTQMELDDLKQKYDELN
jgi:hypothetical protein